MIHPENTSGIPKRTRNIEKCSMIKGAMFALSLLILLMTTTQSANASLEETLEGITEMASRITDRLGEGGINAFDGNMEALEEELGVSFSEPVVKKLKYETVLVIAEEEGKILLYEYENETSQYSWPDGDIVTPEPIDPVCEDIEGIGIVGGVLLQAVCEVGNTIEANTEA